MAGFAPAPLPSLSLVFGVGTILAADQGTLSISGQAVAFPRTYILTADQGSLSISGQSANLGQAVPLYPGPLPHLALLGGLGGNTLVANSTTFAVTGQDAGFLYGRLLTADAGFYTLSGQPSILTTSVNQGGNPAPLPSIGLVLQSTATNRTLTADTGIYSIIGSDGLADFEMSAAQGSYSVTGQDAGLSKTWILVADTGTYSISGQDVSFSISSPARVMAADQGTYAITGQSANLTAGHVLVADQGFYALLGQAAGLVYGVANNFVMPAEQGVYNLFGNDANLDPGDPVLAADCGFYAVTGFDTEESKRDKGAGKSKQRKKYHVKIDKEDFIVESKEEAEELVRFAAQVAQERADQAIERAKSAEKRPARKVLQDARKTLVPPVIETDAPVSIQTAIEAIAKTYQDALDAIERAMQEREEEDEFIMAIL